MAFELIYPSESALQFYEEWKSASPDIIAHTSGSTGKPKLIRLPKHDIEMSAKATNSRFGITPSSVLYCPLSIDYIAGKMMMVRAIAANCKLVLETPSNIPLKGNDIQHIDLIAVVPSQCQSIIDNQHAHKAICNMIVGGAPMSGELEHALAKMPWNTYATYGMTETCSHVALRQVGHDCYYAMPGIHFEKDSRGCLVVNAPAFSFKSLVTNDVVELIDPSQFKWLGRYDNVINSGGIKFFPEQLEAMLADAIPFPFYIKGIRHSVYGDAVTLIIEHPMLHRDTADATAENLERKRIHDICCARLPRYAIPKSIMFVEALPRTSNGKIKR